ITFREGSCVRIKLNNGKYTFKQKGVDALMIMDMYECILEFPIINKMILIASDSDFVPIVEKMKKNNKEVILYTYFDRKRNSKFSTSNQLLKSVSRWNQLKKGDFE
ncbi:MAG: NYN domain-containing protein, partial [Nanoarchaeota archaeon]|nr:NYN domain-containing protein [Nanoarchaeota archaeon]